MSAPRRARVRAFAKINLDLRVVAKRADGYHELRTIFQTVSLADRLDLSFTPARQTSIELEDSADIPDNLVVRAARLAMDAMRVTGRVAMRLEKRIPMGAGLGGGSSDAAAVLLALPVLARHPLSIETLGAVARQLGSDVPFFVLGGTAVGIGRGTELFPLPDAPSRAGLIVAPAVHVSTAEAYRALSPRLTTESEENKIFSFQSHAWDVSNAAGFQNDFEPVVFEREPHLAALKRKLVSAGARPAMMSGSGSALFGLFDDRDRVARALDGFAEERVFPVSFVSRARYRSLWTRSLARWIKDRTVWPPRSR